MGSSASYLGPISDSCLETLHFGAGILAESEYLKEAYELWPLEGRYIEAIKGNTRNADYSSFAFLFVYLPIQLKLHQGS